MDVRIPDIPANLDRLAACAKIAFPTGALAKLVSVSELLDKDAKIDGFWLHVAAGCWARDEASPTGHIHVDIVRHKPTFNLSEPGNSTVDEILKMIDSLIGQKMEVRVRARFILSTSELPKPGIIRSLLGISTKVSGTEMVLSGAKMSKRDSPYEYVEWESEDDETVSVIVGQIASMDLQDDYLSRVIAIANHGLARLAIEGD